MAAEKGDMAGQNNLGYAYLQGEGVERDLPQSVEWFRKSAAQGYGPAENNLSNAYSDGIGVAADQKEAIK